MKRSILIVLCCVLIPTATNLFADRHVTTTGLDSNPCTEDKPCLTVARGIRTLGVGETLFVHKGTYNLPSNALAAYRWIQAYMGETATLVKGTAQSITLGGTKIPVVVGEDLARFRLLMAPNIVTTTPGTQLPPTIPTITLSVGDNVVATQQGTTVTYTLNVPRKNQPQTYRISVTVK
jgi:hypothetical protein